MMYQMDVRLVELPINELHYSELLVIRSTLSWDQVVIVYTHVNV